MVSTRTMSLSNFELRLRLPISFISSSLCLLLVIAAPLGARGQQSSIDQRPISNLSSARRPHTSFKEITLQRKIDQVFTIDSESPSGDSATTPALNTPFDLRVSVQKVSQFAKPLAAGASGFLPARSAWQEWSSRESPQEAFRKIRDLRSLRPAGSLIDRRPSWLYPDDGCFARAEVAAQELVQLGFPKPNKIFAFGDLEVRSKNALGGLVSWWYHVVPAYKYKGKIIIFDPAIEPQKPLALSEWLQRMTGNTTGEIELAVCDSTALGPDSQCFDDSSLNREKVLKLQAPYLEREWTRLEELGRNPFRELGEHPPWIN